MVWGSRINLYISLLILSFLPISDGSKDYSSSVAIPDVYIGKTAECTTKFVETAAPRRTLSVDTCKDIYILEWGDKDFKIFDYGQDLCVDSISMGKKGFARGDSEKEKTFDEADKDIRQAVEKDFWPYLNENSGNGK
jgi:hypothetical protein